jgi:hypothetical protein
MAFTDVTACKLAESLNDPFHRRLWRLVASTTTPIATGWSESCRVGLAPTRTTDLVTAHCFALCVTAILQRILIRPCDAQINVPFRITMR